MRYLLRLLIPVAVLSVAAAACGDDSDDADATTTEAEATDEDASRGDDDAVAVFCEKNDELVAVRGQVYGEPFTESPEEIEALLAEAAVLQEELDALVPEEIREPHELHQAEFVAPIDTLTEEMGWDPFAAINSPEAAAIFADPDINAATEELMAFLIDNCGMEPLPGA